MVIQNIGCIHRLITDDDCAATTARSVEAAAKTPSVSLSPGPLLSCSLACNEDTKIEDMIVLLLD